MSSEKTPLENAVDQALDAFVYAPIGLVLDGPAVFPKLVQQGRNQVQVARMMGQMAVQMGQSKLTERAEATDGPLREVLVGLGVVRPAAPAEAPTPAPATPTTEAAPAETAPADKAAPTKKAAAAKKAAVSKKKTTAKKTTASKKTTSTSGPSALGISDYDSLSASQVVSRLRGLVPDELDAVRAYESANRARKTILNKISQLQKD